MSMFSMITLAESEEEIRLVDDAFGKVCLMINDLSMRVRTLAAQFLGAMTLVSPKFLQQTLDKKLMSNMRVSHILKNAFRCIISTVMDYLCFGCLHPVACMRSRLRGFCLHNYFCSFYYYSLFATCFSL
jgi:hypothetical protein